MSRLVGYFIGYALGWILIYGLYAFAIVAIILEVIDHKIPVVPVILLLTVYIFRKVLQASYVLNEFKQMIQTMNMNKNSAIKTNSDLDKMMERMNQFGGKN
jgi:hypothetical protein